MFTTRTDPEVACHCSWGRCLRAITLRRYLWQFLQQFAELLAKQWLASQLSTQLVLFNSKPFSPYALAGGHVFKDPGLGLQVNLLVQSDAGYSWARIRLLCSATYVTVIV